MHKIKCRYIMAISLYQSIILLAPYVMGTTGNSGAAFLGLQRLLFICVQIHN